MTTLFHGSENKFSRFELKPGRISTLFGTENIPRHGIFFTPDKGIAKEYAGAHGNIYHAHISSKKPFDMRHGISETMENDFITHGGTSSHLYNHEQPWEKFDGESGEHFVNVLKKAGYDSAIIPDQSPEGKSHISHVVFDPSHVTIIKHEPMMESFLLYRQSRIINGN